jgi:hypothetical protein
MSRSMIQAAFATFASQMCAESNGVAVVAGVGTGDPSWTTTGEDARGCTRQDDGFEESPVFARAAVSTGSACRGVNDVVQQVSIPPWAAVGRTPHERCAADVDTVKDGGRETRDAVPIAWW